MLLLSPLDLAGSSLTLLPTLPLLTDVLLMDQLSLMKQKSLIVSLDSK
jgi:hypothetical protein